MYFITILVFYTCALILPVQSNPADLAPRYKLSDALKLELLNGSNNMFHVFNPRCGRSEYVHVTTKYRPQNLNYISPSCRTLANLMPAYVDFIFGCPKETTTYIGKEPIKLYYTTKADQILDWNIKGEQKVKGDLKVVDSKANKDIAQIPVHVSLIPFPLHFLLNQRF